MKIITCSNNYLCQISSEKIDNKAVVKLDFNINQYSMLIPGKGWKDIKYPEEVLPSIKDKMYIPNDTFYHIVELLDLFLETGDIEHETVEHTNRGFALTQLKDMFDNPISIQKSSSIDEKLWFGTNMDESKSGIKKENNDDFVAYIYPHPNAEVLIKQRLHLNSGQVLNLRMAMLQEMSLVWSRHDVADLVDKNTTTANNMIIDVWGQLHENVQKTIFMYACGKGNISLVKKIYQHPENKFLNSIFCTLEEFGLQMSLQPESTKILKFFKIMMKEKDMQLSFSMQRWVIENKLGRKIKLNK